MATEITGRNYEVTPEIRDLVEKKLGRITDKLFQDVIEIRCVLQVEKYRNICEILIVGKEHDVKSVQESDESMQDAINAALDHLKRQAQKNRKKIRDHHRKEGSQSKTADAVTEWSVQVLEPGQLREEGTEGNAGAPRIIKTNNLPIRPMTIEDAAMRLDSSQNEFIVFRDTDTDRVSVIYKRKDNNLGLIAPEF
ncbi:MAG TPA: ribosome-associated translation inhibitor RaiA [Thermoanaerobaculia bacterium]|jgi:putative sigma-54 modulation protein|nr:ribosome-associated translation inhibitor RaiA [Thermoanaerobaculia bacterium]